MDCGQVGKIHGRQGIFRLCDGNIVLKSEGAGGGGWSVLCILFCHDECKKKEGINVPVRGNIEKKMTVRAGCLYRCVGRACHIYRPFAREEPGGAGEEECTAGLSRDCHPEPRI